MRTSILALVAALAAAPAFAADTYRGRLLYETFCYPCHYRNVHFRPRRKVDLAAQIRLWQGIGELRWSEAEIDDARAYLNWLYYGFPEHDD